MEVEGIIKMVYDTRVVSEKFKKRDFVVTIEPGSPYPQHVSFQCMQQKVDMLDTIKPGYGVKVYFNLNGREWTSPQGEVKYFNTITCWKIDILDIPKDLPIQEQQLASNDIIPNDNPDDDLPF